LRGIDDAAAPDQQRAAVSHGRPFRARR
jgi:hypothetical protein